MIKQSAGLPEIRQAYTAMLKRFPLFRKGFRDLTTKAQAPALETPIALRPDIAKAMNLPTGIYSKGDTSRAVSSVIGIPGLRKLPARDREAFNKVLGLHEGFELGHSIKKDVPIFNHAHPDVLLRESNIVATMPNTLAKARGALKFLRTATGERESLESLVPGFTYGKTRLSRHARRRVGDLMAKTITDAGIM